MIPIATSKKQGERLMKAGVPEDSADMFAQFFPGIQEWIVEEKGNGVFYKVIMEVHEGDKENEFYLAWSLSKLWQIVYELDRTYEFPTELSAEELIEALVKTLEYRYTHT